MCFTLPSQIQMTRLTKENELGIIQTRLRDTSTKEEIMVTAKMTEGMALRRARQQHTNVRPQCGEGLSDKVAVRWVPRTRAIGRRWRWMYIRTREYLQKAPELFDLSNVATCGDLRSHRPRNHACDCRPREGGRSHLCRDDRGHGRRDHDHHGPCGHRHPAHCDYQ